MSTIKELSDKIINDNNSVAISTSLFEESSDRDIISVFENLLGLKELKIEITGDKNLAKTGNEITITGTAKLLGVERLAVILKFTQTGDSLIFTLNGAIPGYWIMKNSLPFIKDQTDPKNPKETFWSRCFFSNTILTASSESDHKDFLAVTTDLEEYNLEKASLKIQPQPGIRKLDLSWETSTRFEFPLLSFIFLDNFKLRLSSEPGNGKPKFNGGFFVQLHIGENLSIPLTMKIPGGTNGLVFILGEDQNEQKIQGITDLHGICDAGQLGAITSLFPVELLNRMGLSIKNLALQISPEINHINYIETTIGFGTTWTIIPNLLAIEDAGFSLRINHPTDSEQRSIQASATGTLIIANDVKLVISACLPGVTISASLKQGSTVNLTKIIEFFLGASTPLPSIIIYELNMSITPSSKTFSLHAAIKYTENNEDKPWEINLGFTTLILKNTTFNITRSQTDLSGGIAASFSFLDADFSVSAVKPGTDSGWLFSGKLLEGRSISLTKLAVEGFGFHLPDNLKLPEIDVLAASFNTKTREASFKAGIRWQPEILKEIGIPEIDASFSIEQDKDGNKKGNIEGIFTFQNAKLTLLYKLGEDKEIGIIFKHNGFEAECDYNTTKKQLKIEFKNQTLGSILGFLISLANPGGNNTLSSPWDVLNSVSLGDIDLIMDFNKKSFEIDCGIKINLGFIDINGAGLVYQKQYGESKIDLKLSGKFLGQEYTKGNPLEWDVLNDSPPPVSPKKASTFDLRYLGLGQHIAIRNTADLDSVKKVITHLKEALKPVDDPEQNPVRQMGDYLAFSKDSNWLIGFDFTIMDTFTLSAIFNDPVIYGLLIQLSGEKAKVFNGLEFEILYRKISDKLGLYHIDLTLPDMMRHLEFGAVSITLPVISVDIYTNGNFRVDFGYPESITNFSRSFCVEVFPFTGYGGFYFAVLNGQTSTTVPRITNGEFSPVIEFGFALSIGLGKTISLGILSGGITISIIGIIQGCLAWFNPDNKSAPSDMFFRLKGTLAIIGKVYATVDFRIIKASVDLTVYASATVVYQSYEPFNIDIEAGVSVSVSIKIIFIRIHFHFNTTIHEHFTTGSRGNPPWIVDPAMERQNGSVTVTYAGRRNMLSNHGSAFNQAGLLNASLSFALAANSLEDEKIDITIHAVPVVSRAQADDLHPGFTLGPETVTSCGLLFFIENSIPEDADSHAGVLTVNAEKRDASFNELMTRMIKWMISGLGKRDTGDAVPADMVTYEELYFICRILDRKEVYDTFFSLTHLYTFLNNNINFTLVKRPEKEEDGMSATFFPMFPHLRIRVFGDPEVPMSIPADGFERDIIPYIHVQEERDFIIKEYIKTGDTFTLITDPAPLPDELDRIWDILTSTGYLAPNRAMECAADYEDVIGQYFEKLLVDYKNLAEQENQDPGNLAAGQDRQSSTAASLLFRNYFHMLAKQAVKTSMDFLDAMPLILDGERQGMSISGLISSCFPAVTAQYIVMQEDTIDNIAEKFGMTAAGFEELNPRLDPALLRPGDTLSVSLQVLPLDIVLPNQNRTDILNHENNAVLPLDCVTYTIQAGEKLISDILVPFNSTITIEENRITPVQFIEANLDTGGIIAGSIIVKTGDESYTTQPYNTFRDIINGLGLDSAFDLAAKSDIGQCGLLTIHGIVKIPLIKHEVKEGESFTAIAQKYNITINKLAKSIGDQPGIFMASPGLQLMVNNVPVMRINDLVSMLNQSGTMNNAAAMVSRFLLHGLRLPGPGTTSDTLLENSHTLSSIRTYPVFSLTGQAYQAPEIDGNCDIIIMNAGLPRSITQPDFEYTVLPAVTDPTERKLLTDNYTLDQANMTYVLSPSLAGSIADQIMGILKECGYLLSIRFEDTNDTRLHFPLVEAEKELIDNFKEIDFSKEGLSIHPLPLYKYIPHIHPLKNHFFWKPARLPGYIQTNAGTIIVSPGIWQFPDSLEMVIDQNNEPLQYALKANYREMSGSPATPHDVVNYLWATIVEVKIKQVPSSIDTTAMLPNSYLLEGTGNEELQLLFSLWNFTKFTKIDDFNINIDFLYKTDPASQEDPGLVSVVYDPENTFILKSNLSTESHSGYENIMLAALPGDSDGEELPENLSYFATCKDNVNKKQFIKLLWECSVVKTGGYYLNYISDKKGFPDQVFAGQAGGTVYLTITLTKRDRQNFQYIYDFHNSVIISDNLPQEDIHFYIQPVIHTIQDGDTFKRISELYSISPADLAGLNSSINGIFDATAQVSINNTMYNVDPDDSLSSLAAKHQSTCERIIEENENNTILNTGAILQLNKDSIYKSPLLPTGTLDFEVIRPNPLYIPGNGGGKESPYQKELNNLYSLLGYNIAENSSYKGSNEGIPAGPLEKHRGKDMSSGETGEKNWKYSQVVSVYKFSKSNNAPDCPALPPVQDNVYAHIGKDEISRLAMTLTFQDISGNRTGNTSMSFEFATGYNDDIIPLTRWPGTQAHYFFYKNNGSPALVINTQFDMSRYFPPGGNGFDRCLKTIKTDRALTGNIYFQIIRDDLSFSPWTSLGPLNEDHAMVKHTLVSYISSIYLFLDSMVHARQYIHTVNGKNDNLETIIDAYSTDYDSLAAVNNELILRDLFSTTIIKIPVFHIFKTKERLSDFIPGDSAVKYIAAKNQYLPAKPGTVMRIQERQYIPVPGDVLSMQSIAEASGCSIQDTYLFTTTLNYIEAGIFNDSVLDKIQDRKDKVFVQSVYVQEAGEPDKNENKNPYILDTGMSEENYNRLLTILDAIQFIVLGLGSRNAHLTVNPGNTLTCGMLTCKTKAGDTLVSLAEFFRGCPENLPILYFESMILDKAKKEDRNRLLTFYSRKEGTQTYTLKPGLSDKDKAEMLGILVRTGYKIPDVTPERIAFENRPVKSLFKNTSEIVIPNYQFREEDSLTTLVGKFFAKSPGSTSGDSITQIIKANYTARDFFPAGIAIKTREDDYTLKENDTAASIAYCRMITPGDLLENNGTIPLKDNSNILIPGLVTYQGNQEGNGYASYNAKQGDTFQSIPGLYPGKSIERMIDLNKNLKALFNTSHTLKNNGRSITPSADDSMESINEVLQFPSLKEMIQAYSADPDVIRTGAFFIVPGIVTAGEIPVKDIASLYNTDPYIMAAANFALFKSIKPGQEIIHNNKTLFKTAVNDTFQSLLARANTVLAKDKIRLAFADLLAENPGIILNKGIRLIPPVPVKQINLKVTPSCPSALFPLHVSLTTKRDPKLLAPGITPGDAVCLSEIDITPLGMSGDIGNNGNNPEKNTGEGSSENSRSLIRFAMYFENAFPLLKLASGIADNNGKARQPWVMNFNTDDNGLSFKTNNTPHYFSIKPMSTSLWSGDNVEVLTYTPGSPPSETKKLAFRNLDINSILAEFLTAVDHILSPDYALSIFLKDQSVLEDILDNKSNLARLLSGDVDYIILEKDGGNDSCLENAKSAVYQQLLDELTGGFKADVLVQLAIDATFTSSDMAIKHFKDILFENYILRMITRTDDKGLVMSMYTKTGDGHYTMVQSPDPDTLTRLKRIFNTIHVLNDPGIRFSGKPSVKTPAAANPETANYNFSTGKFELNTLTGAHESMATFLLNVKNKQLQKAVSLDLYYAVNAIEFNISGISGNESYQNSSWLSFIIPFENSQNRDLVQCLSIGEVKIPLPLRNYPDIPVLSNQIYESSFDPSETKIDFHALADWKYSLDLKHMSAAQDSLFFSAHFNVSNNDSFIFQRNANAMQKEEVFAKLAQFHTVYETLKTELEKLLKDSDDTRNVLVWFKRIMDDVLKAWNPSFLVPGNEEAPPEIYYKYSLEPEFSGKGNLSFLKAHLYDSNAQVKLFPEIMDLTTGLALDKKATGDESRVIYSAQDDTGSGNDEVTNEILNIRILFKDLEILKLQNGISSISITRNRNLLDRDDMQTNPAFYYETPAIVFPNKITPCNVINYLIDVNELLNDPAKNTFREILGEFLKRLFAGSGGDRVIKIAVSYGRLLVKAINAPGKLSHDDTHLNNTALHIFYPLLLIPQKLFNALSDWDYTSDTSFVSLLEKQIKSVIPDETITIYRLDLSIYSTLEAKADLPVIEFTNLWLYTGGK